VNKLTGAEATLILNSTAAGILLALSTFSSMGAKKVVVSRGHLYESRRRRFRLTDLAAAAGVPLLEIGSTNRTLATDYHAALQQEGAAFAFYAFPGHFSITGAAEVTPITDVAKITRATKKLLFADLGMGGLLDTDAVMGNSLPSAKKIMKAGADLVLVTGDYMLNGPSCALLLGNRDTVQLCRENPISSAFSCGPLVHTVLEATLEKYASAQNMMTGVPILQLLDTSVENLRYRAQRIARRLEALAIVGKVTIRTVPARLFGGHPETPLLETVQLCIHPATDDSRNTSAEIGRIAARLSTSRPAVWGSLESDTLILDLRCVFPRQDSQLVEAFEKLPGADAVEL